MPHLERPPNGKPWKEPWKSSLAQASGHSKTPPLSISGLLHLGTDYSMLQQLLALDLEYAFTQGLMCLVMHPDENRQDIVRLPGNQSLSI